MGDEFRYLFTPFRVGSIEVKNRMVCLPHGTGYADEGRPTEQQVYYSVERAKGGVGLIIFSANAIHPNEGMKGLFHAYNEQLVPEFKAVTDAVHAHGTPIIAQLVHCGISNSSFHSSYPRWGFTAIPCPAVREVPHEMDRDEIHEIVDHFGRSARNMELAGFDGVELHGAHGYLLNQSMSPRTNKRTDEYGGSLDNRMRFATEVIDTIRSRVAPSFVLGYRISGDEMMAGGLTLDDMCEIAARLEATGKVDYISVSAATRGRYVMDMSVPLAPIAFMAARIREAVSLPVIASQRINDPLLAEGLLAEGQADLIGMARALICDPELPNKAKEGRLDDIRACIGCLQECRRTRLGGVMHCLQNVAAGREKELGAGTIKQADKRKKVVVIGGGPGGMEAARVAAMRGHQVTLFERNTELGGQVNIAALATNREEMGGVARYLTHQLDKLGVTVHLGTAADAQRVLDEAPDAVVVATGSVPLMLPLDGAGSVQVVSLWDALQQTVDVGQRVIVVDGGEGYWQSTSTAEFLANQGKTVDLITKLPSAGMDVPGEAFAGMQQRLANAPVTTHPFTVLGRAEGNTVVCTNVFSGAETRFDDVDTVVLAVGNSACDELHKALKGKVKELHAIGDCVAPRKVTEAMREGHLVARAL